MFFFYSSSLCSWTLVHFFNTFILHSHIPLFCSHEILRKTFEELRATIPHKILFVFTPSVGVKHFCG